MYKTNHQMDFNKRLTATVSFSEGSLNIYPTQDFENTKREDKHYHVNYQRGHINIHSGKYVHQFQPFRYNDIRLCLQSHLVWCESINSSPINGYLLYW